MPKVGDRVAVVTSKAGPRPGVVRRVNGALITVSWESGGESTLIPGPGVLSVLGGGGRMPARAGEAGLAKRPKAATKAATHKKSPSSSGPKASGKKTGKK